MAKGPGFPSKIQVDDSGGTPQNISNDITDFTLNTSRGVQNITGLDKSGMEELLLLADGKITLKGVHNTAGEFAVFKDVPSTRVNRTVTIDLPPATTGAPELTMECIFSAYNITRAANGALTWQADGELADGTEPTWGTMA